MTEAASPITVIGLIVAGTGLIVLLVLIATNLIQRAKLQSKSNSIFILKRIPTGGLQQIEIPEFRRGYGTSSFMLVGKTIAEIKEITGHTGKQDFISRPGSSAALPDTYATKKDDNLVLAQHGKMCLCPWCNAPMPPPPDRHRLEDKAEAAIGYVYGVRQMHISKNPFGDIRIFGMYSQDWITPKLTAVCEAAPTTKRPPHLHPCRCGINIYKLSEFKTLQLGNVDPFRDVIHAITRGHGRIIEHADGYRVQEAEVVAIAVAKETTRAWIQRLWKEDIPIFNLNVPKEKLAYHVLVKKLSKKELLTMPLSELPDIESYI